MDRINFLAGIGIGIAVIGTVLNVIKMKEGFLFWIVSNFIFIYINGSEKNWKMLIVFGVYFMISIYGYVTW
jgi:nicotinamide riboside transporter PnuC